MQRVALAQRRSLEMRLKLQSVSLALPHFSLELDFEIEAGAIGVFGESGSGKTSFLDLLAGVRRATRGTIVLDDTLLQNDSHFLPPNLRSIGYVPQDLALFPHLNVRRNISYGARRASAAAQCAISTDKVVATLNLRNLLERRIADLSGGEKQRVALARAIASRPKLILLDEPFTALDPKLRKTGGELVQQLRGEFSIPFLVVSHSQAELHSLCEVLVEIRAGKVLNICKAENHT
jgi:molybdate transport system ATP-binding protein